MAIAAGAKETEVEQIANIKLVVAAGSDTRYEAEVSNTLFALAASLPNNPRQIKRIVNAFAVYESVGRLYFKYKAFAAADDTKEGKLLARRWRQLAIWVTLATEWPDTWRTVARNPDYVDAAFADTQKKRANAQDAILDALPSAEEKEMARQTVARLKGDTTLKRLLGRERAKGGGLRKRADVARSAVENLFAETRMESDAIYDFNRMMWQPGFPVGRLNQ